MAAAGVQPFGASSKVLKSNPGATVAPIRVHSPRLCAACHAGAGTMACGRSPAARSAPNVIRLLELKPHPEGGHYRETFRDVRCVESTRAVSTAIYFLLARGERSHWHRIDVAEVWHFYAGAPLALKIARERTVVERVQLGPDLAAGERPQTVVQAGAWQAAESLGDWTLAGCTVAPGFEFSGFELAAKGWNPA